MNEEPLRGNATANSHLFIIIIRWRSVNLILVVIFACFTLVPPCEIKITFVTVKQA